MLDVVDDGGAVMVGVVRLEPDERLFGMVVVVVVKGVRLEEEGVRLEEEEDGNFTSPFGVSGTLGREVVGGVKLLGNVVIGFSPSSSSSSSTMTFLSDFPSPLTLEVASSKSSSTKMLSVNPDVILLFSWRSLEADFKDGVGVVVVVVE